MKRIDVLAAAAAILILPCPAIAGDEAGAPVATIVLARNVPAGAIFAASDVRIDGGESDAVRAMLAAIVGKEAKRLLLEGAAVRETDFRSPTLVTRNGLVRVEFSKGPLTMSTEGRALSAGAAGETVKVMNLQSKTVVTAVVTARGKVLVQ